MKKTLIALATLAAAGGAFAQSTATLSGTYGFGFQRTTANASGVATTDGNIAFNASEDLGGGLKASASLSADILGRSGTAAVPVSSVMSTDASLSLSGGFGTVKVGSIEAANGIIGRGFGGAPLSLPNGLDGAVLSGGTFVDIVSYTTNDMGGFKLGLSYTESGGALGGAAVTSGTTSIGPSVSYSAGAFSLGADYTSYDRGPAGVSSRIRVSGSLDLGGVTIGAGIQNLAYGAGVSDNRQAAFGVSAPLGAVKVGFAYATNNQGGAGTAAGLAKSGYGLGVQYDLSKRTTFNVSYGTVDGAVSNQYRARLLHSF